MNVYKKLQTARIKLQGKAIKPSGENTFAKYKYLELGDFLPHINAICEEVGLCGVIDFGAEKATLLIVNTDEPSEAIAFSSPMATAELKGCHPVQNLGAVQSYLRRYLWLAAFEIVEHDALDATTGADKKPQSVQTKTPPNKDVELIGEDEKEVLCDLLGMSEKYNEEWFCKMAGIESVEKLPMFRYEKARKHLNATLAAEMKEAA